MLELKRGKEKMKKTLVPLPLFCAVMMLVGCSGSSNLYDQVEKNGKAARVALVEGTDTAGTTWDPVTATSEVERVLSGSKGKAVDVVLSNNDGMALGIIKSSAFKQAGIPIFGVDALADAIQAIKDGTMQGTIKNDSYTQAHVVLQLFKNISEGATSADVTKLSADITGENGISGAYDSYEPDTKAFRVHHQKITKDNVNSLTSPTAVSANVIGETSKPTKKLFALTYNNADPNMSGLWKPGFNDFGKEYGYQVDWTDSANDNQKALEALDAAVKQTGDDAYDGYLINLVDQTNGKNFINKIPTDKPIIFWNRELSDGKGNIDTDLMKSRENIYYVGIESAEGGRLQGEMAAEWFNANYKNNNGIDRNGDKKIGYIVVRGEKGHADAEARTTASPQLLDEKLSIF